MKIFTNLGSPFFLLALLSGGFVACSSTTREDEPAKSYTLGPLPAAQWETVKADKEGYHFYRSRRGGSMIGLDSVCKRYQESRLETLSKSLTRPLEASEVLEQKETQLDQREALETRARGTMDGIPVEALFVIVRKNNCLFDFSLISRDKILASDEKDFRSFLSGFHFSGSGE